ncbi:MAG: hypothetical protein COA79_05925 [Planctomycetota bacterium]|nr:MAG: hypothetical protein COA79_05925 [Planctomycetota bacterium]
MYKKLFLLIIISILPGIFSCLGVMLQIFPALFYILSKLTFLGLPLIYWRLRGFNFKKLIAHYKINEFKISFGIISGLFISVLILLSFFFYFKENLDGSQLKFMLDKFDLIKYFIVMAIFISFWNSFIEEYYWRMFVLDFSDDILKSIKLRIIWNGLFFSVHHFFILMAYLPTNYAIIFSVGTGFGGMIWAYMRVKNLSIWQCYVSHLLVDLSVMYIGYMMIM